MKILSLSLCVLMLALSYAQADTLFRWTDKEGKVHYGDKPADDAVGTETRKFGSAAGAGDDDLSYTVRKAKQDFPVTLYVSANCGELCVRSRALLSKRGVPFKEKNVASKEEQDALKAKTGANNVPVLMVGKSVLNGFESGQWNSELDLAGYPKTAPYGARPVPPVAPKPAITPEEANPEETKP